MSLSSIKHTKVDSVNRVCERSLCSLLSCCPFCSFYALTVSPCLHTAGVSPRATGRSRRSAFSQMASWSPHRDWTLDTERAWVCVLAALLPTCLFCRLPCEPHATEDFCVPIWRLIILVHSHPSHLSNYGKYKNAHSSLLIRSTYTTCKHLFIYFFIVLYVWCISPACHRGCCGFMLSVTAQVAHKCPCFVTSKEADE